MTAGCVPAGCADDAPRRGLRALDLAAEGRSAEAVEEARAAVESAPSAAWVHVVHSAVLREAHREQEAVRAADEAVRLAPEDGRAHRTRAAALAAAGRREEAHAEARRATQLAPDDATAFVLLGDLSLDLDPAEATRFYRRGLLYAPRSAAAHAGLARALRRLGRRDEAEVEYERASTADPAVSELRRRAAALFSAILQAAIGTFVAVLMLGWIPDIVGAHQPHLRGTVEALARALGVVGPLALLGWTALRVRRLGREAPTAPGVREDLRDIARELAQPRSA